MNTLIFICLLFLIFLQGCSQSHPASSAKDDQFTKYVDANIEEQKNEVHPIVNVAF